MKSRFFRWIRYWMGLERAIGRRVGRQRLAVEMLEDRVTPSVNWVGGNADWSASVNNWLDTANNSHHFPTTGNDVRIENDATVTFNTTVELNTLIVSGASGLDIEGGTLTLDSASTIANLTLNAATLSVAGPLSVTGTMVESSFSALLTGTGDVTIAGPFAWTQGTMSGPGHTFANGGLNIAGSNAAVLKDFRQMDNNGSAIWPVGAGNIVFQNGAEFNNNGTFDVRNNANFFIGSPAGADSAFNNNGIFKKTAGDSINNAANEIQGVPFNNTGTVDLQIGTVRFSGGGTSTGPWTVAAPAHLDFTGGTWNLNAGSKVTGDGNVFFVGGTVNLADSYSVPNTVIGGLFGVAVGGAVANFNATSDTSTLELDGFFGGTLGGSGNFTITGLFTWTGGTMNGGGTTTASGGIILGSVSSALLDNRQLDNAGTATLANNGSLGLNNGAVFNNGSVSNNNAVFDAHVVGSISDGGGTPSVFNNFGTFRKSADNGTTTVGVLFNNAGTIDEETGTLSLTGGLTSFPALSTAAIRSSPVGATESGTRVTITTTGFNGPVLVGQAVTISGVNEAGYNGTFTVTAVLSDTTFQYTSPISGLPNSVNGDVTFLSTSTLTGGTYLVSGTLQFTGANIVTNAANIVLNGPASAIQNTAGADALANFGTNAAGGSFTIQNGRNYNPAVLPARLLGGFSPGVGQLIGLAFDPESGNVFAYPRGSLNIVSFTPTGTQVGVIQHPGIFSSDFDMDFTPEAVNVGGIFVPAGTLLAVNGDDSPDQLYALDKTTGTILASVALASPQGDQEQVGIAYHAGRHTVFVVDDVTDQIREIDPSTGAQLNRFPVQPAGSPAFGEVFGDLEVDSATGNLLVASSQQNVIRVLTPTGAFVTDVSTAGVASGMAGLARDDQTANLYISTTSGAVLRVELPGFVNTGNVVIGAGSTFTLSNGGTSTGDWVVAATGTLQFSGTTASYLLDDGTDITGAGQVAVKGNATVNVGDDAADVVNISNLIIGPAFDQGTVNATGTLHVTGPMDVGSSISTGFLSGSGNVTVGGLLTLGHGAMSGSGTTSANGGLSLQIGGGGFELKDGRHLDNNAPGIWSSNPGQPLSFRNGAVFTNNSTFDIQVDSQISNGNQGGDLPNAINNTGIFKKTAGNGTMSIGVPFNMLNNAGSVDLQTGTFTLRGGGTSIRPWTVAAGATLDFAGDVWNLDAGSTVSGEGTVRFEFATVNMADTYSASHTEILFGGKANFNADSSTTTLTFGGGDNNRLGGSGDFTVNGLLTWGSGFVTGTETNTLFANGDITLNIQGGSSGLDHRQLILASGHTATLLNGSQSFPLSNGAVFNNHGTFDVQTDVGISDGGAATSTYVNNGTFKKSAGAGTTTILVPFTNNGTIDVQTGTVSLNGPGGGLTNFPSASSASIDNSPTGATESGTTVTITIPQGHQFVVVGQTVTISGVSEPGYNGTFTVTAVPSPTTFQYTAATSGLSDSGGGTATFFSDSTLTGGTYLISGTFQFTGANIVTNAANIVLNGPASAFLNTSTATDALANFASNAATGSFTIQNGRNFTTSGAFSNAGNVSANAGTSFAVAAGNNYTQTGGTTTVNGSLSADAVNINGGLLNGTGIVNGALVNAGDVAPGNSPGTLTVNGTYTQTAAGVLDVEIASTSTFDRLQISGAANLGGTINVTRLGGFAPALNDAFQVLTYGSVSGDFAVKNGYALGNALAVGEQFNPTNLTLVVGKAQLSYQVQPPAIAISGQPFQVKVLVSDANSVPLLTDNVDQVTLTLNQNAFHGGGTSITQPVVNGVATFNLTIDQGAGGYALTAGGNGFADVASNTFAVHQAPAITSADHVTFTVGSFGTFTVQTTGFPTPSLNDGGFGLPNGITFIDNGNGTATLSGMPTGNVGGIYSFTITAHNALAPDATQNFTLTVNQAPAITSADNIAFTINALGTFSVQATGFPIVSLGIGGFTLPSGVNFVDNGNGTATLSGTPALGTEGVYHFTITAANGIGTSAVQNFTLTVHGLAIVSPDRALFSETFAGSFTVLTTGFPTPSLSAGGFAFPADLSFQDNGNGTATITGTPQVGVAGIYHFTITAHNGFNPDATQNFTLTITPSAVAPEITSADHATFTVGTLANFTVTATGVPTPSLGIGSFALPAGVNFTDNHDGTATLTGTPTGNVGGTYTFTITAHNGSGPDATQSFTLTVNQAASIASANSATFTVGTLGAFTITTHGFPTPTLSIGSFTLPSGVTFADNHDGTATLAGTPTGDVGGAYTFTITAHNGIGSDATQTFTLTVDQTAEIRSADNASFVVGSPGSFTVTTAGFPKPSLDIGTFTLPNGIIFTDNHDGTATLAGMPTGNVGGVYTLTITAHNGIGSDSTQTFSLTVNQAASITSADHVTFTVGSFGSFTVATQGFPAPSLDNGGVVLPTGITFTDNHDGTATLAGTPTGNVGGTYAFTITAHNGSGSDATQNFTLTVNQTVAITSVNHVTFIAGVANSFTVTTVGFPFATLGDSGAVLPAGINFSNNGDDTATLSGTPTGVAGAYPFNLTAANAITPALTQVFTLTVAAPPRITSADHFTFTVGKFDTLTITASPGVPTATTFKLTGALPTGVTLTDNKNGTATLKGIPAAGKGGVYPISIIASNAGPFSTTQNFTLTVNQAPSFSSAAAATFNIGVNNTFTISTKGFPTAAITPSVPFPAGVNFHDNNNGTATLSGVPTVAGATTVTLTASNGVLPAATQTFKLTVAQPPVFTSSNLVTFQVGHSNSFNVTTTPGNPATTILSVSGPLPAGLTFIDNKNGTGKLSGTPAAGIYHFTIVASNAASKTTMAMTLTVNQAPAFTSAASAVFTMGQNGAFTIKTKGFPTAAITHGSLPGGISVVDNGNGTATLNGAATSAGVFTISLTADNGILPAATQNFKLTVHQPPAFTSAANFTMVVGQTSTFNFTTSPGSPAATTLTLTGTLPTGVTFTDNKNGTAKLTGKPAAGKGGVYHLTVTASNAAPAKSAQAFTLTVNQAPAITSAAAAIFSLNQPGSFTIKTTGFPAAAITHGVLPAGINFTDNGNGTATLSGTPTVFGLFNFNINADNGVLAAATQAFKLTVNQPPVFTSGALAPFQVGTTGSVTITTTPGVPATTTLPMTGKLPLGVVFTDKKNGTATLSGKPAAGTGGVYHITITASNGASSKTQQSFTLNVNQAPTVSSVAKATFNVGQSGAFTITTKGFPLAAIGLPGLPAGLSLTDNGNGTTTVSGTPLAGTAGVYHLTITATNSVSSATQSFTLTVNQPPIVTSDPSTTFTHGVLSSFTFTASGVPAARYTLIGTLPAGLTFTSNANGTATLKGIPTAARHLVFTIAVTKGALPVTFQLFDLTVT